MRQQKLRSIRRLLFFIFILGLLIGVVERSCQICYNYIRIQRRLAKAEANV